MGEMDDPLQKAAEQLFEQIGRQLETEFPGRRRDIDALLMGPGMVKKSDGRQVRGVKGSVGRPPINKSVLAGWILLLIKIVSYAEFKTRIDQGQPASLALIPSNRWAFNQIAELGLSFTIDDGANPIRYPLNNASTLKRHRAFAASKAVDHVDAMQAFWQLTRHLSAYLERLPVEEAYYFEQLGDDPDLFMYEWRYLLSLHHAENPEPWRKDFQAGTEGMEGGPTMTLHFPRIRKARWAALRTGLGIFGFIEIENLKKRPPTKKEIADHREFRRNTTQPTMEQLRKNFGSHGS